MLGLLKLELFLLGLLKLELLMLRLLPLLCLDFLRQDFMRYNIVHSDFFRGAIQKFSFCRIFSHHPRGLRSASHPAEEVRAKHQRVLAAAALEARMEEPGHGPSHGWKQVPVSKRSLCKVKRTRLYTAACCGM